MPLLRSDWDNVEHWLKTHGSDILIIIVVILTAYVLFRAVLPRLAKAAMMRGAHPADAEMERRADTILSVMNRTAQIALLLVAVVTILPELGINITAIVTGLGISGLALALGSQQLVRDGINGIFLLAEDQYRTGDVVTIAGVTGTVEAISLRRTILRDDDGVVHSVPNGAISVVANHTRDYAQVNVEVRVSYGEDLDRVSRLVEDVGRALAADERFGSLVIEPPRTRRVESVGDAGVAITVTTRARPSARWDVASELRRRLAQTFLDEGIHVPYPVLKPDEEETGAPPPQAQG